MRRNPAGRLHHRGLLRRKQHRERDRLCEELLPVAVGLDPALELAVVPVVLRVGDVKVISALKPGLLDAAS